VKVDGIGEVLLVPKSSCRVLDPLNLRVDRLAGGIGHPMDSEGIVRGPSAKAESHMVTV
jgi:hypothetical protein